jgi:regulator of ribonuclease activity A
MTNYITPDLCDEYPEVEVLFGGEVVTIKCHEDNSLVKESVGKPGNGKVMVVDGGGSMRNALLGDMLAEKAAKNGWEGFVIFGCIRDIDVIMETNLGVQALAVHPRKTEKKGIGEINVPVKFAGVQINPGDYIYADNNGVIVSKKALTMPA